MNRQATRVRVVVSAGLLLITGIVHGCVPPTYPLTGNTDLNVCVRDPACTDKLAMGHRGMSYSLPSRELIADMVESVVEGHALDGLVLLTNCDKITPGMLMATARLNVPAIVVTAGPMMSGRHEGRRLSLVRDTFEAMARHTKGELSAQELEACEAEAVVVH